jgi:hypothetical protein
MCQGFRGMGWPPERLVATNAVPVARWPGSHAGGMDHALSVSGRLYGNNAGDPDLRLSAPADERRLHQVGHDLRSGSGVAGVAAT